MSLAVGDQVEIVIGKIGYRDEIDPLEVTGPGLFEEIDLRPELVGMTGEIKASWGKIETDSRAHQLWIHDLGLSGTFFERQLKLYYPPKDLLKIRREARRAGGHVAPGMRKHLYPKKVPTRLSRAMKLHQEYWAKPNTIH